MRLLIHPMRRNLSTIVVLLPRAGMVVVSYTRDKVDEEPSNSSDAGIGAESMTNGPAIRDSFRTRGSTWFCL